MRKDLEEIKLSGIATAEKRDLTNIISTVCNKDPYRLKIYLMDDYWRWNFSSPYITINQEVLDDSLMVFKSIEKMNLESLNKNIYTFNEEQKKGNGKPSFSTKFGDWTIEKGDFILPPPEIRFRRSKRAILNNLKKEFTRMIIILPITVLIVLYLLKSIFETT